MRGLLSILSLFRKEFNKFNDTGARILDLFRIFIYHMTLKILFNRVFCMKALRLCHIYAPLLRKSIHGITKSVNHKWYMEAQWLSGRVLDSRPRGHVFEPRHRHYVVPLSKTH